LGKDLKFRLNKSEVKELIELTNGYSASDISNLVSDAAMGPVRELGMQALEEKEIPPVTFKHFKESLASVKPSYSVNTLKRLNEWDENFGSKINVPKLNSQKSLDKEKDPDEMVSSYKQENKGFLQSFFGSN